LILVLFGNLSIRFSFSSSPCSSETLNIVKHKAVLPLSGGKLEKKKSLVFSRFLKTKYYICAILKFASASSEKHQVALY
jgi:hypothetical protein